MRQDCLQLLSQSIVTYNTMNIFHRLSQIWRHRFFIQLVGNICWRLQGKPVSDGVCRVARRGKDDHTLSSSCTIQCIASRGVILLQQTTSFPMRVTR